MNIAVICTGAHGQTYGQIWASKGHSVVFGARDPESDNAQRLQNSVGARASAASVKHAIAKAEIVLLAVRWSIALEIARDSEGLAGKIVIDPTNSFTPDLQLAIGNGTSVAEEISRAAPAAKVVKAFNTLRRRRLDRHLAGTIGERYRVGVTPTKFQPRPRTVPAGKMTESNP